MLYPFLVSCVALPPEVDEGSSPLYAAIEDVAPQGTQVPWQPWDQTPGLDYFSGQIQKPRMKFHAIRVDLNDPSLKIIINHEAPDAEPGKAPGAIASTFVSSFVRRYDCLAGINTAPFDISSGREGEARVIKGISIADGKIFSPPHPAYDALVFYKDGRAAIVNQSEIETFDDIENAAGGFFRVLENGELAARLYTEEGSLIKNTPRYPRSAAGLSPDGRCLYLLVIDGRQRNSRGATGAETGRLLKQLGASGGLYFDGGGSTALALRDSDGQVKVVNTPVHNNIPGRERAVASCLGIARR